MKFINMHIANIIILLFIILNTNAFSQVKADTSDFKVIGYGQITIEYVFKELPDDTYEIEVNCKRESDGQFVLKPQLLAGDFGKLKEVSGRKKIRWNMTLTEIDTLERINTDDFYFEVTATPEKSWLASIPWYYYASAGLLAGSAALYFFIVKDEDPPARIPIGAPPVRP